jgi:membrane-bound lytic murein transglycosylase B
MTRMRKARAAAAALLTSLLLTGAALAAPACQNKGSFEHWLGEFKREAATQGIPSHIISAALDETTLDPGVIRRDRAQGVFAQSFLQFSDRMVSK